MSVDRATVRRIAHLARLAITAEEEARLEKELSGILDWVAQLDELDTSNVEPMTRVAAMTMKKREDRITDGFCAGDILKNAPMADDHYFVVPKIVE
ncbi:MAG: Asp-tRNA(Asn)/Glu-tRNA(Gln) amidotransferase subunit GatC [Alphaproteobacteria bacterium]|nr:Asp-tRNA(Asn)/Glu-tRNA(Gln) amidotransferase subunit GatC [Alphaproteobacteria bacterium]